MSCQISAPHHFSSCCNPSSDTTPPPRWWRTVEQVTAVALALFALHTSAELFLPFFLLGTALGGYQALAYAASERGDDARMGCSRGLMEQLTRVQLPRFVSLVADVAVMGCHLEHHPAVFVPMVAIYTGANLATIAHRMLGSPRSSALSH